MTKTRIAVSLIVSFVAALPIAFVGTLLIHPFWRWFEGATGIESYGHSGPSEWCYWLGYTVAVAGLSVASLRLGSRG